ncbi:MAG: hypothetical protein WB565_08930 [Acidimicrobiales bacterium]
MVRLARSRSSPSEAASRLAAIRALVTLGDDDEDLDSATYALRLLGVSDGELLAALAGELEERARAS